MKKILFILTFFLSFAVCGIAQNFNPNPLLKNIELQKTIILKDLAYQIHIAESVLKETSRTNLSNAKQKINTLYSAYLRELKNQKASNQSNGKIIQALEDEINLVNSIK